MLDAAHGGKDWKPRTNTLKKELGKIWGDIGAGSEYGRLRRVLLHRPGKGIENVRNASKVLWTEILDPRLAREQHDSLAKTYKKLGVEVFYLDTFGKDTPNLYFMRDLFVMTPNGAILSRPASRVRSGEEKIVAKNLINLDVPILLTVHGDAVFEGPDIVFINKTLAFVGYGIRSNMAGVKQVTELLNGMGVETLTIQTTYGCGHLDGVMNIVDKNKAILFPTRVSYQVYETLKKHGMKIIDLPDLHEAEQGMAINMVPVAPSVVVMPSGNKVTKRLLEKNNIECHEVNVSELMKGGGSVHCMTGIIKRDE